MKSRLLFVRLAPVLMLVIAAGFWFHDVQEAGPYVFRNLVPLAVLILLAVFTLYRGQGTWTGSGWRMPLGVAGFAVPALGLSAYLHYAFAVNLNGLFTDATNPDGLFRFLPVYTLVAGAIGFIIGWIVGRNV
jgi:hypothetical protein